MDELTVLLVSSAELPIFNTFTIRHLSPCIDAAQSLALAILPDIVLIDYDTCGADSFALCRRLRRSSRLEASRIILVSAVLNRPQDRIHALRCGASELLPPEIDSAKLAQTVLDIRNREPQTLTEGETVFLKQEAEYLKESHFHLMETCSALSGKISQIENSREEGVGLPRRDCVSAKDLQPPELTATVTAGVAHDFNNILAGVIGFAEIGLHLPDAPLSCKKRFAAILRAGNRAVDLVNTILLPPQKRAPIQEPVDVPSAATEALELMRAAIPAGIQITETHVSPLPQILGERSQFQNLLTNLVVNAWHAIGNSPGHIVVQTDFSVPSESHRQRHAKLQHRLYVQVKVSDSGCGIAPEHLNRIFDAFFTTKAPSGGRGLGLSLVSDMTNAWNGVICVDSLPARGATFTLYFPPVQLSVPVEKPSLESLPRGNGERVLFVDDEEALGLVVSESLSSLGYHASFAPTPELALEKNHRERFDIVITDLHMPRMTGVELAKTLWKTKPQQRVILTTGLSGKLTPEAAYAFGFAGLLMKPFKKSALASALQQALTQETITKTIAC